MPVKYSIVKDLDCGQQSDGIASIKLLILVGLGGLEPPTSPLSGVRSSHLSYRPGLACYAKLVELVGIEPATS